MPAFEVGLRGQWVSGGDWGWAPSSFFQALNFLATYELLLHPEKQDSLPPFTLKFVQ